LPVAGFQLPVAGCQLPVSSSPADFKLQQILKDFKRASAPADSFPFF